MFLKSRHYGEVYVNAPLDRESVDRYLLKVRATDNGSPARFTDRSLTINILDVNDNAPVIQSQRGYNVSISEASTTIYVRIVDENDNAPEFPEEEYVTVLSEGPDTVGATIATVTAVDPDEGLNGTLRYAITQGNLIQTFNINSITGRVTAVKPLDYEISNGHYALVVTATDQCPIPSLRLTSSTTVMVNVLDINDVTPTFPRRYEGPFEVTEGQPGPRVCTVKASDVDSGLNGEVEYSMEIGSSEGAGNQKQTNTQFQSLIQ